MAEAGKFTVEVDDAKYIRDQFALAVLPKVFDDAAARTSYSEIAERAYDMADAMMKAREARS